MCDPLSVVINTTMRIVAVTATMQYFIARKRIYSVEPREVVNVAGCTDRDGCHLACIPSGMHGVIPPSMPDRDEPLS